MVLRAGRNQQATPSCRPICFATSRRLSGDLHDEPSNDRISDGYLVNVPPLQLSEEVFRVHFVRLHEALVPAAFYLGALDLKSTCNVPNL